MSKQIHIVNAKSNSPIQASNFGESDDFNFVVHQKYDAVYQQDMQWLCTNPSFKQWIKSTPVLLGS